MAYVSAGASDLYFSGSADGYFFRGFLQGSVLLRPPPAPGALGILYALAMFSENSCRVHMITACPVGVIFWRRCALRWEEYCMSCAGVTED